MKYVTPIFEKTNIEAKDVITSSVVEISRNENGGADYKISFSSLFGKNA